MSFQATAFTNLSEDNRVSKTLQQIGVYDCTLKSTTSIIDPTLVLTTGLDSLVGCNYLWIPSFGRYYFVQDIVSLTATTVALRCHVDVLMSFKDQILANKAIVMRQQNKYNLLLNDSVLRTYQNPKVVCKRFAGGFPRTDYSFILATAGG